MRKGPWTVLESTVRFRNSFMTVVDDRVLQPDGQPGSYATVQMNPGVCVLPIDADGNVHLTRQFRYGIARDSIEVVAGGVEDGEEPLTAARRELSEELGIAAQSWQRLAQLDLDTSMLIAPAEIFLCRDLSFHRQHSDPSETIAGVTMPLAEALAKVVAGEITHVLTVVLLLCAERARTQAWQE
ncbi:MAG TPA: NUDIX hydrolase [Terriglobales bacterium]|nr:NUDIX hydrolase [Terriglobales bacterium]